MSTAAHRPEDAPGAPALTSQHLTFRVGNETFAMPISRIREIRQFEPLTEVPLMPAFIRGVLNLRGSVVPVIDLKVRLGKEPTQVARRTSVVVAEVPAPRGVVVLGLMVEQVEEVVGLLAGQLAPAPTFGSSLRPDFVAGLATVASRLVIVLDVVSVLSVDELARLAQEARGGA